MLCVSVCWCLLILCSSSVCCGFVSLVVLVGVGVCRLVVKFVIVKLVLWLILLMIGSLFVVIVCVSVLLLNDYRFLIELLL